MFNFKELFALIGLLLVIGIVGIMYRLAMERPVTIENGQVLCSQDIRTCANGLIEKRQEPACTFATCPQPVQQVSTTTAKVTSTMARNVANDTSSTPLPQ